MQKYCFRVQRCCTDISFSSFSCLCTQNCLQRYGKILIFANFCKIFTKKAQPRRIVLFNLCDRSHIFLLFLQLVFEDGSLNDLLDLVDGLVQWLTFGEKSNMVFPWNQSEFVRHLQFVTRLVTFWNGKFFTKLLTVYIVLKIKQLWYHRALQIPVCSFQYLPYLWYSFFVEYRGLEPLTLTLRTSRSTRWANTPAIRFYVRDGTRGLSYLLQYVFCINTQLRYCR